MGRNCDSVEFIQECIDVSRLRDFKGSQCRPAVNQRKCRFK
jgi:hypothetical protein